MDLSRFKRYDWLIIGGGVGFLIFGTFLDWISFSGFGASASAGNAFDFFLTGTVPWLLIVGAAVVTFLLAARVIKDTNVPWPVILLAATALGTLLVLLRLLFPAMGEDLPDDSGVEIGRAAGLWLSVLSAIVATVGAAMSFQAHGGSMSDLTDPDRLRSSFRGSKGSSMAPPPPPPPSGSVPPPPPPPAP
jgi:hypothetical protein